MARSRKYKVYVGDFETTVFNEQEFTEVWASALVELHTEKVTVVNSIEKQWKQIVDLNENMIIYYHNLAFDGSFWMYYLLKELKFKHAFAIKDEKNQVYEWKEKHKMLNGELSYSISSANKWYSIIIKYNNRIIEMRDSLKLLPYSVERIGKAFKTKHKKLNIKYKGFRFANGPISEKEEEYIKNDVLVVKEALELMFSEGHNKLTIGSCAMSEYKNLSQGMYEFYFPKLSDYAINPDVFRYDNVDAYIRRSYRGGWCYVVKGKERKIFKNGVTIDVNSLYPSVMHSSSGCRYPTGYPTFWHGNYLPKEALENERYFFIRFECNFYLKEGMLPFVQIKGNPFYKGNQMLETSDILDNETGIYYKQYYNKAYGKVMDTKVTMTMTMTDYKLFLEHYYIENLTILDGCYFETEIGIFDDYINKYAEIKKTSTGARREEAKLFLNNLYGKFATNTDSSYKISYIDQDGILRFYTIDENEKKAGYIPVGSAITSYAREFTIRVAQQNYYGADKEGFIYADTDSIHIDIPIEKIKGVKIHKTEFNCWSIDAVWKEAYFERQKTYIERVVSTNNLPKIQRKAIDYYYDNDSDYTDVKCAGLPKKANLIFRMALDKMQLTEEQIEELELEEETVEYIKQGKKLEDFTIGLYVPQGNLKGKQVEGGVLLIDKPYVMW